ncbi:EAL domain-containing protein [Neobacillus drentensis]|uniref:EAL domain-containing protein n=1 Tax=Neobacillus drentensis TaxID=220684 RepID=UPI00285E19E6|nr:EAL domain-containing protein [Neobacillus drentensis]MDR7238782.1 PAS domain S-box-containing protein [Neobacillus drentensis]
MEYEIGQLETDLRLALSRNEFCLYYQPILDLVTGEIIGVEALIRWKHPEKGLIPPVEFVSSAEETGLIIPIGEWILRTACIQNKVWQEAGYNPILVSVNLSARQVYQPNFADRVSRILKETKLAPEYLIFEITEGIMLDSYHAPKVIKELKQIGLQISLDDFGTGFNSLQYLQELPVDKIKIDQSFIKSSTIDSNDATIVKMIIEMAHQLKLDVIAEGIETKDQLIFLQQNLCNQGQGYFFSKPLPSKELEKGFYKIEQIVIREGIPQELNNQKWMKEIVESSHRELRDTVGQHLGIIFKSIEKNGKFIHTFSAGKLLYKMGFTPEHIIGKELNEILPIGDAEEKANYYRRAWKGEENVTYEWEVNGIYYLTSLNPIFKGGEVREIVGSCVEITNQKRVEETLRISESNYRHITDKIQDVVVKMDVNGTVLYASPSHEKVFGIQPKEYEGYSAFELVHHEDIPSMQTQFTFMINTRTSCQVEFRHQHAQGGWVPIEAKVTPVFGENDEFEYFIAVGRDVSERKKAEEFVRKSEKLSVVGQLASSIAHEIRNPLTTIKGFAQLLQKEVDNPLYMDTMLSEIDRLEEIVRGFLSFAKPQTHQIKETNINRLFQQVLLIFKSQTINNIEILQEYNPDFPVVQCDGNQIKQVFVQILQNAVEAMPNGGTIKVQMLYKGTDYVKIRFIDQGYGISKERMSKMGEPFYSTIEKGTGLGIMISQKIVKEHGGTIAINSFINQGTTVDVILPVKQTGV